MQSWNLLEIDAPEGVRTPSILHSGDARAIALRLDPGQSMGDHQVRERAWVTVVEGTVEIVVDDEHVSAPTGTLIMFDPAERHSVSSAEGARLLLILAPWPADGHYGPDEVSHQTI